MTKQLEKPFELLRKKDGSEFSAETIRNWYVARAYVLDRLQSKPVVITSDSDLMLAVARQVALSAHFINVSHTVITIVSQDGKIVDRLEREEFLCNLPKYCRLTVNGELRNADSYVDIELNVLREWKGDEKNCLVITEDDLSRFCQSKDIEDMCRIDTRKAVLASRIYDKLGSDFENLSAEDIHCTQRYAQALDAFQYVIMKEKIEPMMPKELGDINPVIIKEKLSNIFCADCFETRAGEVKSESWDEYNEALSRSEHDRWVVEKLIMGYRELTQEEHLTDEYYAAADQDMKRQYRKKLKRNMKDPAHIDLCSYSELRRIDPDSLKYDSFLMLAIPGILKKVKD